mgnify:CR=1 FL=1
MIKKVFIFVVLFYTKFVLAQKLTIVDYFNILPDSLKYGYELKLNKAIWQINSNAEYIIYPIVDLKNGYIEINDEGTGGGTKRVQVALFRKSDGDAIIAVSYSFFDGFFNSSIYFLQFKYDKWTIINNEVLPSISYKQFMKQNYVIPSFPFTPFFFYYDLPHFGTTINVKFHYEYISILCQNDFIESDLNTKQNACNFLNNVLLDSMKLYWNKQNSLFQINKNN